MNERIDHCLYLAGLTASGCWDELDTYAQEGIERLANLIVAETIAVLQKRFTGDLNREDMEVRRCIADVQKHFGVEA
jgi:hypothetical protein